MLNIFRKNTNFGRNTGSNLPLYYDNINVEGKTEQATRSGKNVFKNTLQNNGTSINTQRCIATLNNDEFILTTTASGNMYFGYVRGNGQSYQDADGYLIEIPQNATNVYLLVTNTDLNQNYINFYDSDKLSLGYVNNTTATIPNNAKYIIIRFGRNDVESGIEYTTKVMVSFEEITSYEPYGVMPSPDFPSELVSVGYKNLFNPNDTCYKRSSSTNIITIEDNKITFQNTNSSTAGYVWWHIPVEIGQKITINYEKMEEETENANNRLQYLFSDTLITSYDAILNNGAIMVGKTDKFAPVQVTKKYLILILRAPTNSSYTITNLQIITGNENSLYIPYGKYGVEIKNVGKNVFSSEMELGSINNTTGAPSAASACIRTKYFIKVLPNTEYTIKNNLDYANYRYEYDENLQLVNFAATRDNPSTFTTLPNTKYVKFRTYAGNSENNLSSKWQLEKNQATNYEPYTSHTNLIVLEEPLSAIGNTRDRLYIKDNILYVERKIKSLILNGSENWTGATSGGYSTFRLTRPTDSSGSTRNILCNYFKATSNYTTTDNSVYFGSSNLIISRVLYNDTYITNVNNFKNWLSTHNVEVLYILTNPIVETYELDIQPMIYESAGFGTLSDVINDPLITEELNGSYILEFEYLKDGKFSEYLVEENIVKAHGEPFSIYSVKKDTESKIKILAKHWVLNEWTKDFILDSEPTNLPAQSALSWIQNRSINHSDITITGDCTDAETARYVRKNMLDAIFNEDNAILKRFGGELSYNINNVTVNNRRGSLTGLTIRQGKNLTGAEYYLDFSTVVTRLVPVGKDGLMLDDVYVDSPLINNYATPIIKKVEVDTDNPTELENYCNALFESGIDKPTISIKIDFVELSKTIEYQNYSSLETAHLGDTVNVYIPSLKLNVSTRVVKTVYNDNLQRITSLELGNTMPNIATSNVNTQKQLEKQAENDISVLAEAKQAATEMINHPFAGNIYIDEDTGNLYIMDTDDISTAQNIWRWGLGGLGFSSNGINGPYTIAMTQDGKIVADFITAGILQSIEIRATIGTVGGFTLSSDKFTANISKEYNFTLNDVQKVIDYANGTGTLTDEELDEYDVNGDGVVDKIDGSIMIRMYYEYISNIINGTLEFNSTDSRRVITLKDSDGNVSTSLGLNGIKTQAFSCKELSLDGVDIKPQSILTSWYSTSPEILKNAKKHQLLVILATPASGSAIMSMIIPTSCLTTSNQQFQCADEVNYTSFYLKYNDDDIIITGAGRSSNGSIVSAYTVM